MIQLTDTWAGLIITIVLSALGAVYLYGRQQSKIDSLKEQLDASNKQNDDWRKQHTEEHRIFDNGFKEILRDFNDDLKNLNHKLDTLIGKCGNNNCKID